MVDRLRLPPSSQQPPPHPAQAGADLPLPAIQSSTPYSASQLRSIFGNCLAGKTTKSDPQEGLKACAATLTARFIADGYINSRVYITSSPGGDKLEVVQGRIAEIRVRSSDARLAAMVRTKVRSLVGSVLYLPTLQRQLLLLKGLTGVGQVQGNLGKVGSDPTQAVLTLTLVAQAPPGRDCLKFAMMVMEGLANGDRWRRSSRIILLCPEIHS